ncbi:hypothetical protein QE152_g18902 [Popillia japonica]|uniref:Uncharacterized protein n=1 Tax=Popillia japonica TaxID=7064 RepID=A0AAW1KZR2_POPJA
MEHLVKEITTNIRKCIDSWEIGYECKEKSQTPLYPKKNLKHLCTRLYEDSSPLDIPCKKRYDGKIDCGYCFCIYFI